MSIGRPHAHARPNPAAILGALVIALAASWFAPVAGIGPVEVVRAAATDLTLVTDTVYTVQPDQGRVRVTMTVKATNTTRETQAKRFYFDHGFLAVLPTASNPKLGGTTGGRARITKRTADGAILRIDFGSRLYSGKSRTFKVSFDLVDLGKPANRQVRVGTSLVTLPVWAHASPGAKGGTVTVRVPAGYEVTVESGSFDAQDTTAGGGTELRTKQLPKPLQFFAYISAQRPAEYTDTPLSVAAGDDPIPLLLRGWQDDPAWTDRVSGLFRESLPVLRQEIGIPWPHAEPLVVQEALNRSANGYAGLFDPAENLVEVAYWADHSVVIHEAAHGWFNGSLLADRWANEGFASLYAARAAKAIGEDAASPALTEALQAAAFPLNEWAVTDPDATPAPADPSADPDAAAAARTREQYGYAASLALATAIADRAGDDTLRQVWADAEARLGAYQPPLAAGATAGSAGSTAEPETIDGAPDWRGMLDLLEERTGQDFTDLWRQWVVRPEDAALLDARAAARASYERTLALADGWALPRGIRDALRAWQFDTAEQLMADTRTVLAQRGAVEALAAQDDLALPGDMQGLFEAGNLVDASARAEAERNAMLAIQGAAGARTGETDPLTTIGMLGEDPEADLATARAALQGGDLEGTLAAADDAYRAWNGAWQEGRRRTLLLVAVLATILVLVSAVIGRLRKGRHDGATSTAGATAGASAGATAAIAGAAGASMTTAKAATTDADPSTEEILAASAPAMPETHAAVPAATPPAGDTPA